MNTQKLIHVLGLLLFLFGCETEKQPLDSNNEIKHPYEPAPWYDSPTWSPDGEWIAYTFWKCFPESIYFVHPDGTENHAVTRGRNPDFSPDMTKLVLSIGEQIFVCDLKTGEILQLTFEASNYFPRWSPDGKRIAYDSNYQDPRGAQVIWLMDPDGGNKKNIGQYGREPDWFPDFRILHKRSIRSPSAEEDLFIMDSTGTNAIRLTTNYSNRHAKVSFDGRKIIWQRWDVSQQEIAVWLMNANGGDRVKLIVGGL